jgi:hypothetical protein
MPVRPMIATEVLCEQAPAFQVDDSLSFRAVNSPVFSSRFVRVQEIENRDADK